MTTRKPLVARIAAVVTLPLVMSVGLSLAPVASAAQPAAAPVVAAAPAAAPRRVVAASDEDDEDDDEDETNEIDLDDAFGPAGLAPGLRGGIPVGYSRSVRSRLRTGMTVLAGVLPLPPLLPLLSTMV